MKLKNKWREFSLILLGVLVILSGLGAIDTPLGAWIEIILGAAIIVIGGLPLFSRGKQEKLPA